MSNYMPMTPEQVQWVKDYRAKTGCTLVEARDALRAQPASPAAPTPAARIEPRLSGLDAEAVDRFCNKCGAVYCGTALHDGCGYFAVPLSSPSPAPAEEALREVVRRASLPITPKIGGLPATEEECAAALARCARLTVDYVVEPGRALLSNSPPCGNVYPGPTLSAPPVCDRPRGHTGHHGRASMESWVQAPPPAAKEDGRHE